eukprot:14458-Heterococcus_DN1.PRE.4
MHSEQLHAHDKDESVMTVNDSVLNELMSAVDKATLESVAVGAALFAEHQAWTAIVLVTYSNIRRDLLELIASCCDLMHYTNTTLFIVAVTAQEITPTTVPAQCSMVH